MASNSITLSDRNKIKELSYQNLDSVWEIEIAGKVVPNSLIISITDLGQQLDYPNLNEFTVGSMTVTISDPDSIFSPHNRQNYFVTNGLLQTGYRASLIVKAGFKDGDQAKLFPLFIGEIIQIDGDELGADLSIQADDMTQDLRNKNITNFGITKTFALEGVNSRANGNYPVPFTLREISQHSITRMFAKDKTPRNSNEGTFFLEPGVGTPPFIGPGSPYLYERERLATEGKLDDSLFYEVTSDSIRTERPELEDDLTVTCKVPYRHKTINTLIKQILNHVDTSDYSINAENLFDHNIIIKGDRYKGNLSSSPSSPQQDDFYYNTTDEAFYVYDSGIFYNDIDYSNNPHVPNNFTVIRSRAKVDAVLKKLGFNIIRHVDVGNTLGKLWESNTPDIETQLEIDSRKDIEDRQTTINDKNDNIYNSDTSGINLKIFRPKANNDRSLDIRHDNIDIPSILLPEGEENLASKGRVGYDFESYQSRDEGVIWHWTGYVTDFVYERPVSRDDLNHAGRYYFLYTAPLDKIPRVDPHLDINVRSKLIQYDVGSDSYNILYEWGKASSQNSSGIHERGEFWGLAHNSDFTEFYILATRSTTDQFTTPETTESFLLSDEETERSVTGGIGERANYDSLEITDSAEGKVVILKVEKVGDRYVGSDFVSSTVGSSTYSEYHPQLAYFYPFASVDGTGSPLFHPRLRILPDNRRNFIVKNQYLYYPCVQRFGSINQPDRFGYARVNIDTSTVSQVCMFNADGRTNHMGFDLTFDATDNNIFYCGYIHQDSAKVDNDAKIVPPKSKLKIIKGTIG